MYLLNQYLPKAAVVRVLSDKKRKKIVTGAEILVVCIKRWVCNKTIITIKDDYNLFKFITHKKVTAVSMYKYHCMATKYNIHSCNEYNMLNNTNIFPRAF